MFSGLVTTAASMPVDIAKTRYVLQCAPIYHKSNSANVRFRMCVLSLFFVKNNTLCSIALNSLITEPGLYVFWLEFQVVTQLSSAVLIVFRTVKRAIKDLRAEGVSLVL